MLACARIGAPHNVVFGGFSADSVRERMEFSEAKALITVDGARRKGKTAPIKAAGRQGDRRPARRSSTSSWSSRPAPTARCRTGATSGIDEICDAADPECPAEELDAEHPLYILYTSGSTAKPKGILHTTGGYLTGVSATHKYVFDLKPERGRVLVRGRCRLGHRPLLHRLRAAVQRRHVGDVRGRPGLPAQGDLVGDRRALRRDDLLHGADRDPRLHEVGRRAPSRRPTCPSCGCWAPSASRSTPRRGCGTTRSIGGERCPIVDTWWQTETGAIMITPLPGIVVDQARVGDPPVPGDQGRRRRRARGQAGR